MKKVILISIFLLFSLLQTSAKNFVQVTDQSNPVVVFQPDDYWAGASWIDFNNDNKLDLFVMNRIEGRQTRTNHLYKNLGDGKFTEVNISPLTTDAGYWFGCSWADFNNDGYVDAYVNGLPSQLYINNGDETFTKVNSGDIAKSTVAGISSAWADYNNDGYLDVIQVWPEWLQGPPSVGQPDAPFLFTNSGAPNFEFSRESNTDIGITTGNHSFLQPSWTDFDDDGDMDLFISAGSGAPNLDFIYRNQLVESGTATFERYLEAPMGTDSVEGNFWSWIDIDNDLDLDGYLTNWANVIPDNPLIPKPNKLYINDNGSFSIITEGEIVTDEYATVGNTWHDYDNDGDLDCITVSDSTFPVAYYKNNGDGTFIKETDGELASTVKHQASIVAGDYDNDGDLDLYITGYKDGAMLFNNESPSENNWVMFRLEGVESNRSAIDAKILIKAIIAGEELWQRRDVYSPNTFFGQSSMDVHFGLKDAAVIDSLIIEWPSGQKDSYENVNAGSLYKVIEGEGISTLTSVNDTESKLPSDFRLMNNYPNPFNPSTTIEYALPKQANVELKVFNSIGQSIKTLVSEVKSAGTHKVSFDAEDLVSGVYFYQLQTESFVQTNKMILMK